MTIKVVFYGGLSRVAHARSSSIEVKRETLSVGELRDILIAQTPELREQLENVAYALGDELVAPDRALHDGAELGLLPPVSGG
ncbi:MAG TPA: MoaD/ThiS family protein [Candidatus Fraserbacteria bacterium]|nr:MoaD/ThiS family protein [Candidatus Fraserbacteria bacterium]